MPRMGDGKEAEGEDRRGPYTPEDAMTPLPTESDAPLGARTPRGHRTKAQAPGEGDPAEAHLTHRTERPTRTRATRIQRAKPHLTTPPSHQPAT